MFRNLVSYSFKSFKKQKGYVLINIIGLSLGIASSLIIFLYIINELSYDRFNEKSDRIYKLLLNGKLGGQEVLAGYTAAVIAPTMNRDFPEIEDFCRINQFENTIVRYEENSFEERHFIEADSSIFNIFSIPLVKGNPKNVLNEPNACVVSETTALRLFGDQEPVGKVIEVGSDRTVFTVSGVMQDIPSTSHFEANIIGSFMTNPRSRDEIWLNNSFNTYLLLYPNTSTESVDNKIPGMLEKYIGPQLMQLMGISIEEFLAQGNKYTLILQPLLKIHLDPTVEHSMKPSIDPKYLYIFGSIALLIIIIAAINFMNLSTAKASRRAKEIGIKKVGGSTRFLLISQFLIESTIIAFAALIIAVIIVKLSIPYFNDLLDSKLSLGLISNWYTIPSLIVFVLIVGIIAGSYPAFYLSSISPDKVLRSDSVRLSGHGMLRSILVVFQFTASIILIIGTVIMYRQIDYLLNKDMGFNKEQMMVITRAGAIGDRMESFKSTVKEIPGVENISAATAIPGRNNNQNGYLLEGRLDETLLIQTSWVDYDFAETYHLDIVKGRFFDRAYPSNENTCIINESTVEEYNLQDPLSYTILAPGSEAGSFLPLKVIGVVKDFNFEPLSRPIDPYIMRFRTNDPNLGFGYITVKLEMQNMEGSIAQIESVWKEFTSNDPLIYFFLDEDLAGMLRQERQSAQLALIFAFFAMAVSVLGLYGLTSFMLQQRTKELGIRKAMGSSASQIFILISRNISLLVVIAAVIGIPLIYLVAVRWLQNYHYRISPDILDFLSGFLIVFLIAIATISYRTLKAARIKPAQSLKYE